MVLIKWWFDAIFLIFSQYTPSTDKKKYKLVITGFQLIAVGWRVKKSLDLEPSLPKHASNY